MFVALRRRETEHTHAQETPSNRARARTTEGVGEKGDLRAWNPAIPRSSMFLSTAMAGKPTDHTAVRDDATSCMALDVSATVARKACMQCEE